MKRRVVVFSAVLLCFLLAGATFVSAASKNPEVTETKSCEIGFEPTVWLDYGVAGWYNTTYWGINADGELYLWGENSYGYGDTGDYCPSQGDIAPWVQSPYASIVESLFLAPEIHSTGMYSFSGLENLQHVNLPDTFLRFGSHSFEGCISLSEIVIPDSVYEIELKAFAGCTSLREIVIPDSVTNIRGYAFSGCSALTDVTLPSEIDHLEHGVFKECSSLESISLPETIESVGKWCFSGCSALADIDIPDGVSDIGCNSFEYCVSLLSIDIPQGVSLINERVFRGCSALTHVGLPEGLKSIGYQAFKDCSSLSDVIVPSSVKSIDHHAFYGCSSLTDCCLANLSPSVEYGKYAFALCTRLTSFDLHMTCVPEGLFSNCTSLRNVTLSPSTTKIGKNAFHTTAIESIVLPDKVRCLEIGCFKRCRSLKSIYVPRTLIYVEDAAFEDCDSLHDVYYAGDWNLFYQSFGYPITINGVVHYVLVYFESNADFFKAQWHYNCPPMATAIQNEL